MQRLALSDEDKSVRDWFIQTMKDLKCQVTVDEMGNIFAVRPGKRKDVPATFIGSHLDTQPTGGRYDGILGVLAGVEVLKRMEEMGIETEGGVGVVNWTKYEDERPIARQNETLTSPQRRRRPIPDQHGLLRSMGRVYPAVKSP